MKEKLFLKIDNREKQVIDLIISLKKIYAKDIECVIVPLDLGDFILCSTSLENEINKDTECKELIIFERKSLLDLAASIKDGRYAEQSLRLDSLPIHNHNIQYIIEGNMDDFSKKSRYNTMPVTTIYSSLISILNLKGFSVIRTFDIIETTSYLLQTFNKLSREICQKNKKLYYDYSNTHQNHIETETETENIHQEGGIKVNVPIINTETQSYNVIDTKQHYVASIKKVKKQNITPENIGEIILSQIPGISTATSLAIINKSKSLYNLMVQLREDSKYLDDIRLKSKSGVERKISRKAIDSIKDYILYGSNLDKMELDI